MTGGYGSISGGQSKSSSNSFVWKPQRPYLKDLYADARGMSEAGNAADVGQYQQYLDMLNPMGNPYMMNLQNFMQPNGQMMQDQIDVLSNNLTRNFNENLMPGIQSNHVMGGTLGGGRQGIAEGVAMRGTQDALASGVTDILSRGYDRALGATTTGAGLLDQYLQTGMRGVTGLEQMRWNPLMNYAQIIGRPTVLNSSDSSSWNFATSGGFGAGGGGGR